MNVIYFKDLSDNQRFTKVINEIQLQNDLDHPNILKIFEYFIDEKFILDY